MILHLALAAWAPRAGRADPCMLRISRLAPAIVGYKFQLLCGCVAARKQTLASKQADL